MTAGLHIVGLPHTCTTVEWATCAYTQKVRKLAKMHHAAGRRVTIYAGAENDAPCTEHVPLISEAERVGWFGAHNEQALHQIEWQPDRPYWQVMNYRAVAEILQRAEPHDLVLLTMGHSQHPIRDAADVNGLLTCEPGVGYIGTITHAAYESYAWMHHVYGIQGQSRNDAQGVNGKWFDTVIPNYFDPDEFAVSTEGPDRDEPYLLFMGRVTDRKGPHIAARIANEVGIRLIVAGPGGVQTRPGEIIGDHVKIEGPQVEYVGSVGFEERLLLMQGATALLAPTLYIEPFGGVAVEAMLCGTPAITTDWGAFTETVREGVTGYRFRTLAEGVAKTRLALELGNLDRSWIRSHALDGYSLESVRPRFDAWFGRLDQLWRTGWDELPLDQLVEAG